MHWFESHLICLSLTKPKMQQCFHPSVKHLLYRYITFFTETFDLSGLFVLDRARAGLSKYFGPI